MSTLLCVSGSNKNAQLGLTVSLSYSGLNTSIKSLSQVDLGPYIDNQPIIHVECSEKTTMFLTKDKKVWYLYEKNVFDSFNKQNNYHVPKEMKHLAKFNIIYFTSGSRHTVFLTDTHNVVVGGNNSSLQLGLDNRHISVDNPIMLNRELFDDQNVLKIVCGARFTYFLTEDNVYCCGENSNFQLFHGDAQPKTIRKLNPKTYNDEQIVDVACSNSCTFLLSAQGHVFCTESWLESTKRSNTKLSIKASTSVPKENTRFDPIMIDPEFFNNQKIAQVSAGYDHVVFLTKSGECYSFCTSYHNQGQDGGPSSTTKLLTQPQELFDTKLRTITRVICSKNNTAFITADECIYVCGANQSGTLAQGHEGDVRVPSLVRNSFLLINSTGKAFNVSFGMEHMVIFFTDKNTPIGQVLRKMHSKRIYSDITIHFGQK